MTRFEHLAIGIDVNRTIEGEFQLFARKYITRSS